MANRDEVEEDFEMREEYDFSNGRPNPYAARMREQAGRVILLEPDLYEIFPDSQSVNQALRLLLQATDALERMRKRAS